jgi:hypothetical protein
MGATSSSREEETPGERIDRREKMVLAMMLEDPFPWTVEEIGRALNNQGYASDSVDKLAGAGLVHRLDGFVFPTRAARRADEIYDGAI